jgi:hypothetical protein
VLSGRDRRSDLGFSGLRAATRTGYAGSVNGIGRGRGKAELRLDARGTASLLLAVLAAVVVGCDGSDESQSTSAERPPGIEFDAAKSITLGVPRAKVIREFGDPILTSEVAKGSPGGCLYFPMEERPLVDVFQYCLDEHDQVNVAATAYSLGATPPPQDASAARQALIGRGDVICSVSVQDTGAPGELVRQIEQVTTKSASEARRELAALMRKFSKGTKKTRAQLEAFNAPPDELSELDAYVAALDQQTVALARAATALAAGDAKTYDEQLQRAKDLGDEAEAHASQYGFATCAGIKLS